MNAPAAAADPVGPALARWCERTGPWNASRWAVAFSAGADSTALLRAAHAHWPGQVVALHVHHGLQAAADGFETQARQTCEALGIALQVSRLDAAPGPGQSPEDAARDHRYRALARMALEAGAACVLLGQHADDQVETLMLALGRGAGLPGLAGMAEHFERHGMRFGRPLLELPAPALRAWLQALGQPWVEDPSNADPRFTRNRIRRTLLPAWEAAFPGFRATVPRSMRHVAQAQHLLADLAGIDLAATGTPPAIAVLQGLSRERQANALRHWLREHEGVAPSAAQLDELLDQVAACRTRGHAIRLKVADGFVLREGPRLRYTRPV